MHHGKENLANDVSAFLPVFVLHFFFNIYVYVCMNISFIM